MKYTIKILIKKLDKVPKHMGKTNSLPNGEGPTCVLGHLGVKIVNNRYKFNSLSMFYRSLLRKDFFDNRLVGYEVNDNLSFTLDRSLPGNSIKERVINHLKTLEKKK